MNVFDISDPEEYHESATHTTLKMLSITEKQKFRYTQANPKQIGKL